jgi:hypothetical protein
MIDTGNHRLGLWRLGHGTLWKHLGSQGTEPGQFTNPKAVAVTGSSYLVVTDERRVQVLTVEGAVLCALDSTAVEGVGSLGRYLLGVTVCTGTDEIFVADAENHRVVGLTWSPPSNVRGFIMCGCGNCILHYFLPCFRSTLKVVKLCLLRVMAVWYDALCRAIPVS